MHTEEFDRLVSACQANDFVYHPESSAGARLAKQLEADSFLMVGPGDSVEFRDASFRHAVDVPRGAPNQGTYFVRLEGTTRVMSIAGGSPPHEEMVVEPYASQATNLWIINHWMDLLDAMASQMVSASTYRKGDRVLLKGSDEVYRIERSEQGGDSWLYDVASGSGTRRVTESGIKGRLEDRASPEDWIRKGAGTPQQLATLVTHIKLQHSLTDHIYSIHSSRTVFMPYQFVPVIKFLEGGTQRILIADEVGLGKTIEAGLIWNEMDQRGELKMALVVCPSNLVGKWQDEMRTRFDRSLQILDVQARDRIVENFKRRNFEERLTAVVSLESLRRPDMLQPLVDAGVRFDLVIIDEAHNVRNPGTKSADLARALANMSEALVLLSATPVNLRSSDLFNLLNILREEEYNDELVFERQLQTVAAINRIAERLSRGRGESKTMLAELDELAGNDFGNALAQRTEFREIQRTLLESPVLTIDAIVNLRRAILSLSTFSSIVTRTRKVDVPEQSCKREAKSIEVNWDPKEKQLYSELREWFYLKARISAKPPGFVQQMPLRLTASCLPAAVEYLRDRILTDPSGKSSRLDDGDLDLDRTFEELGSPEPSLDFNTHGNAKLEKRRTSLLRAMAQTAGMDTKFKAFEIALGEAILIGGGQIIVFSYFKGTIKYLHSRLSESYSVEVLNGDVHKSLRPKIMERFREGRFQILLMSEIGSEGLDFEFCNSMFNYDLPWNPMRVEQRIGRLDRFGQPHDKIHIFNFIIPGTIDTDIFQRLYDRIGIFERSIGALEPILGDGFTKNVMELALDPNLTDSERQERVRQTELALVEETKNLDSIDAARNLLVGTDELIIKGLNTDRKTRGNYVGESELMNYVDWFLNTSKNGSMSPAPDHSGYLRLRGTPDLVKRVRRHSSRGSFGSDGYDLANAISDEEEIRLTFSSEVALRSACQLVTLRHSLAKAARSYLEEQEGVLNRFGTIECLSDKIEGDFLVLFYLVGTTGIKPSKTLVPFASRLDSTEISPDAGYACLAAIAEGKYQNWEGFGPGIAISLLEKIKISVSSWHIRTERDRQSDNNALRTARREAITFGFGMRIDRMEERIQNRQLSDPNNPIVRIWRSLLRDMELDRDKKLANLEALTDLAMTMEPVVLAQVRVSRSPGASYG